VTTGFTDEDDYGQAFFHVIPVFLGPVDEGERDYRDVDYWIRDFVKRLAKDGGEDIGWPRWSDQDPWSGSSIESSGDGLFYKSISADMLIPDSEFMAMDEEEQEGLRNESKTILLSFDLNGCFDTPELAVEYIYNRFPVNPKVRIWCIQPDPEDDPEFRESVDSYDVVNKGLKIDPYCEPLELNEVEGWIRFL